MYTLRKLKLFMKFSLSRGFLRTHRNYSDFSLAPPLVVLNDEKWSNNHKSAEKLMRYDVITLIVVLFTFSFNVSLAARKMMA